MPTGLITVSQYNVVPSLQLTADDVLEVRGWYTRDFIGGDGTTVVEGNFTNGQQGPYYSITPTLVSGGLTVPAHEIQATSLSNPTGNYIEQLWVNGAMVNVLMPNTAVATGWQIPTVYGDPISFDEIATYNRAKTLVYPNNTYFTADETIAEIQRIAGLQAYAGLNILGRTELDTAPAIASVPIAVGLNSPRISSATKFSIVTYGAATTNTAAQNATAIAACCVAAAILNASISVPLGTFSTNSVTISCPIIFESAGAILAPATGQTVTITSAIVADTTQHFSNATAGLGTVSFAGNKKAPPFAPQWWGAAANGIADDTAAIQAAMAAAVSVGGGTVVAPAGTYNYTSLSLSNDTLKSISLIGEGPANTGTTFQWLGTGTGFLTAFASFAEISGIYFHGNNAGIGVLVSGPNAGTNSHSLKFNNCIFQDFDYGVSVGEASHAASEISFKHCTFDSNDVDGVIIANFNTISIAFKNCNFTANGSYGIEDAGSGTVISIDGDGASGNGIADFHFASGDGNFSVKNLRSEMAGVNGLFIRGGIINLSVENCSINNITAFAGAVIVASGNVHIKNFGGYYADNPIYIFGDNEGAALRPVGSVTNVTIESSNYDSTLASPILVAGLSSSIDGLNYTLKNNLRWLAGNVANKALDETGIISPWPGRTSRETLLQTNSSVDMNTATASTLFTCPTGRTCVITKVVVRNASTSLTTASYSFGWTSAAFNDVIANAAHTELTGSTLLTVLIPKVGAKLGPSGGTFKVLMNTLQGGAATTSIDVYGFLTP